MARINIGKHFGWLKFIPLGVGLMFGLLAGAREVIVLFSEHPDPLWQRKVFWACVWIASLLALLIAWIQKNRELLAQQAKNAKAEISGAVREVFFDKDSAKIQAHPHPSGDDAFEVVAEYNFTASVFMKNLGAPTTIEQVRYVIQGGERAWYGHKLLLQGQHFHVVREGGLSELLDDVQELNDDPLTHSRSGWLRFRVSAPSAIDKDGSEAALEIEIIDKYGESHKLVGLSSAEWKKNRQTASEHIVRSIAWIR